MVSALAVPVHRVIRVFEIVCGCSVMGDVGVTRR